jgi:tetratricopeptide (TPR) repeat protein
MIVFIRESFNKLIKIALAATIIVSSNILILNSKRPILTAKESELNITIRYDVLKILSLGNERLLSSYYWITTLLASGIEREEGKQSWIYNRFNLISMLDNRFYENYLYGGIYLSIIKDDPLSASKIFSQGLDIYPEDFKLLYYSAFNYFFELGEVDKATPLYEKLIKHQDIGNHPGLANTISKILSTKYDKKIIFNLLLNTLSYTEDGPAKDRSRLSLYALKAEIDLDCLNNNEGNCHTRDFDGNDYIFKEGRYQAQKKWKPFKISKRIEEKIKGAK